MHENLAVIDKKPSKPKKKEDQPNNSDGDEPKELDRTDVYFQYTPLGETLKEAIQELELEEGAFETIKQTFNEKMKEEFAEHFKGTSTSSASRFKLNGDNCSYNNNMDFWFFNTGSYNLQMEDNTEIKDSEITFAMVPHDDFQMKSCQKPKPKDKKNKKVKK
uniref:Uncharacterized protein n=1 Tax=Strombidium inclinatum TaxID=197538 RepID=A0A7S3IV64_9SPIT|mmetsp:Transcript_39377/g.60193  ORF Transcript_39377/g.60193 Transcript_39377/m.60193 type:complete len:162 (+) Transcript_39377:87-572(+)